MLLENKILMSLLCSEVTCLMHACLIKTMLHGTLMDCVNTLLVIIELRGVLDEVI